MKIGRVVGYWSLASAAAGWLAAALYTQWLATPPAHFPAVEFWLLTVTGIFVCGAVCALLLTNVPALFGRRGAEPVILWPAVLVSAIVSALAEHVVLRLLS